jgi:hypothetical protein
VEKPRSHDSPQEKVVPAKNLDQIEIIDVAERDRYCSDPMFTSLVSALFSLRSWFRTRAVDSAGFALGPAATWSVSRQIGQMALKLKSPETALWEIAPALSPCVYRFRRG